MASLDSLPPDQRAVLALVLERGRSYDEIARSLSIDRAAVRDRALSALDALGPPTRLRPEQRALITDYLLGQLPPRVSGQVRDRLAGNASERAWATVLKSELAPLSTALPEIPGAPDPRPVLAPDPRPVPASDRRPVPAPDPQPVSERPRSRLGGAILLAAGAVIAAAVVVVVIVVGGSGSTSHRRPSAAAVRSSSTTTTSASTAPPQPIAQINLGSPQPHGVAKGIAEVVAQGANNEIAIVATGLAPNKTNPPNAYAVWLYNSPIDSLRLGFVNPGVGSSGRLQTAGQLPADAAHYKALIVTLETQAAPRAPGPIVLEGTLTGLS